MGEKKDSKQRREVQPGFHNVSLNVYRVGQGMVPCALDDPRATTIGINSKGERCSAQRPISNVFAVEIRSTRKMTGACRALLHSETWEQPLGQAPSTPANSLFIAKAFELAETQK